MGRREELHQAVDELVDENFMKMLYKIATCKIRKETNRRELPDTGENRFINRVEVSIQGYLNTCKNGMESSQIKRGLEAENGKAQNLKSSVIKKIEGIEDIHHLKMIYGFVDGFFKIGAKEAVYHGNEKKDCN
ncbi:MAG: hypothetical protein K2M60_04085 [Lachnospiraceae bacterium]|nr:hypothetical protein [Lachnospiraceae bacterium]MDE6251134.1 hypothetical protein [Lachnospiraceae bacterium]